MRDQEPNDLAEYARDRFREGRGAEFQLHKRGKTLRLLLIPSPVFSDETRLGLAIACESEGFHFWDGSASIQVFDLVSDGFSLTIAEAVAELVREIFPFRVRRKLGQRANNRATAHNQNR